MTALANLSLFDLVSARSRAALRIGLPACIICAALFIALPQVDLFASQLFFDPGRTSDGALIGFWLKDNEVLKLSFTAVDAISRLVLVVAIVLLVVRAIRRHSRLLSTAVVALSLIFGPAVVVNSVFKDHWDRARPRQIQDFGGDKQFSAAWIVSNQCDRNCAFTSGHAAAGFSFIALHFVARGSLWLWLSLAFGGLIGASRIAVGAHFLSDVVFSFFLVYLISAAVAQILVTMKPATAKAIRI
ncbi:MAG: phosphatase PAP2 family protein [Betaproteobacteria bacterium]|jgi:lipid A 4'-phosphatase|nr:phosphatase PAP2 family protein [Betaproteobacteria bacterium]